MGEETDSDENDESKQAKDVDEEKKSNEEEKAEEYKRRLEQATKLIGEAKEIRKGAGSENEELLSAKMEEIKIELLLPGDWKAARIADVDKVIAGLENEIKLASNGLELKPFDKLENLIAGVSDGMVRYGLLYPSENCTEPELKRGQCPALQYPKFVENLHPKLASQTEFYKSTAACASTKFVQNVESSGLSVATGVPADYLSVSGNSSVCNSKESSEKSNEIKKSTSTEATVIKCKSYPMKAFRVPKSEMKLSPEADCDVKKVSNIYDAKTILDKYGSHIPAGVHHLGGIFCDMINIQSEEEVEQESLTTAASNQLGSEVPVDGQVAPFGGTISGSLKIFSSKEQTDAQHAKEINATYTRNIKGFGPDSANMEMFSNIVASNNATWCIIDRGDLTANVPLWDLLKDLGDEYRNPAHLVKEAWTNYHNIPDKTVRLIEDLRSFVAAKLTLDWNSDSVSIMNDIMLEIDKVQQQIGDHCNLTTEVLRIQTFNDFLKAVINSNQPAKGLICQMLKPEVYAELKGTVTLEKEIEDLIVKKAVLPSISKSKVVESVLLRDIPATLSSLIFELTECHIDNETCISKIASILTNAKVENIEKELYGAVIQKAKEFGYQPDRLTFTDTFDAGNLKDLAECLDKLLDMKFVPGDNVTFEFKTKDRDLGWKEDALHRIEVTGKVEKVEGFYAYVEWHKLDNLSLSSTGSTFSLVKGKAAWSPDMCSKLLGCKADLEGDTGLKYKMPFWELKHCHAFSESQQQKDDDFVTLAWKDKRMREEKLSFSDLCMDHPSSMENEISVESIVNALNHRTDVFGKCARNQENSEPVDWSDNADESYQGQMGIRIGLIVLFFAIIEFLQGIFIALKHSLSRWIGNQNSNDGGSDDCNDNDDDYPQEEKDIDLNEPFCILLKLLSKCNLSGKQAILRKLCDQRYSIPLIYRNADADEIWYLVNSLRFAEVKLRSKRVELMEDRTLPRVVFISQRNENLSQSLHMAKAIFECNMGSHNCDVNLGLMAELCVGSLTSNEKTSSNERDPWLLLHVKGDYTTMTDFIEKFSDLIIFEVDVDHTFAKNNLEKLLTGRQPVLQWKITNDKLKANAKKLTISGSFHDVASKMTEAIAKIAKKENLEGNSRHALSDISDANLNRIDDVVGIDSIAASIKKIDFSTARDLLDMQKSFADESKYKLDMQQVRGDSVKIKWYQMKVEKEIEKRRDGASQQVNLPILADFLGVLQIEDKDLRIVALNELEKNLNEECGNVLRNEKKRVNDAWDHYISLKDQPEDESALKKYFDAKLAYASKSIGFEHLWRELSHIYVSRPLEYKNLPDLAAQHLTDGFVFEILDGDAGIVNGEWMKAVLLSLNRSLKKMLGRDPQVCVLSIMGIQNTGKSTILNTMFGCRLKVSACQCTRGMNLQLVKTEKRSGQFDYILVMDTEGLRSPEFFGTDGAIWRDNRLATFSILPADATIITTINEEDAAIKEILPIVMLALKGSNVGEEISGRLRSMMFFVYSRVDTSKEALDKLDNNRHKLQLELQEAVMKIEKLKMFGEAAVNIPDENTTSHKKPAGSSLNKFLRNFRLDDNEDKSDVKYLGSLNEGHKPPNDTPNYDFGEKVAKIREYIFDRLSQNNFQGQSLKNWSEYLDIVCKCIDTTDFELSFKTAVEFQAFNQLKPSLGNSRQKVSKGYSVEYKLCEEEIFNVQAGRNLDLDALKRKLHTAAQETILQEEKNVRELLDKDVNKRFKTGETSNWNSFIKDIKKTFENLLKDCFEAKFVYGDIVSGYGQKILDDLREKYGENPNALKSLSEREKVFKGVFQKQLRKAKKEHPPTDIYENINKEYASLKHINIKLTIGEYVGKKWDSFTGAVNRFSGSEDEAKKFDIILQETTAKAGAKLDSVTNYDASVVQEVIEYTEKIISDKKIDNKNKRSLLHAEMKRYLQLRFTSIQNKWDEEHNIARKLENEEGTLRQKFDSICDGFIGRHAVATDIVIGIKAAIKNGFTEYVAEDTKGKVEIKPWISKSEVMQAHVDSSLISLSKQEKTKELFNAISRGSTYYEEILSKLILAEVDSESCWDILKETLCEGIPQAAAIASTLETGRHSKFMSEVNSRLESSLKKHLPSTTWTDLLQLKDTLSKDDFIAIGEIVKRELKTTLSQPQVDDNKLAQNIKDQLKLEGLPDSQPRCSVSCPKCGMTCRKPASHVKETGTTEAKHDCKHQPVGLNGIYWVEGCSKVGELVDESCDESVRLGHHIVIDGKSIPFSKFEEVYDSWQLPNCTNVAKVRKYLFRKHQKELAKYHGKKECSMVSGRYDLETLESELNQIISE